MAKRFKGDQFAVISHRQRAAGKYPSYDGIPQDLKRAVKK